MDEFNWSDLNTENLQARLEDTEQRKKNLEIPLDDMDFLTMFASNIQNKVFKMMENKGYEHVIPHEVIQKYLNDPRCGEQLGYDLETLPKQKDAFDAIQQNFNRGDHPLRVSVNEQTDPEKQAVAQQNVDNYEEYVRRNAQGIERSIQLLTDQNKWHTASTAVWVREQKYIETDRKITERDELLNDLNTKIKTANDIQEKHRLRLQKQEILRQGVQTLLDKKATALKNIQLDVPDYLYKIWKEVNGIKEGFYTFE